MATQKSLHIAAAGLSATNRAVNIGLTTGIIAPLTTVAGLQAAVLALGTNYHKLMTANRINKVFDHCKAIGLLTNTNVAAADTVAGLRTIFTTENSNLSISFCATYLGD